MCFFGVVVMFTTHSRGVPLCPGIPRTVLCVSGADGECDIRIFGLMAKREAIQSALPDFCHKADMDCSVAVYDWRKKKGVIAKVRIQIEFRCPCKNFDVVRVSFSTRSMLPPDPWPSKVHDAVLRKHGNCWLPKSRSADP